MSLQQLRKEIKELKEEAGKKPNPWPWKRTEAERQALIQKYRDMGLWDNKEE